MRNKINLIAIVLIILFTILSFYITNNNLAIDIYINAWGQGITSSFGIKFFNFIAGVGDTIGIVIISLLVIGFLYKKKLYLKIGVLIGSMALTVGASTLVKFLVARDRPENRVFEYHGNSFPSGHTTMTILFYGMLLFLLLEEIKSKIIKKILILFSITLSLLVVFSRIYLSVHWFSDIIGGILLGSLGLLVGIRVYNIYKN